jgi:hypothetical protein
MNKKHADAQLSFVNISLSSTSHFETRLFIGWLFNFIYSLGCTYVYYTHAYCTIT